jgi:hypothetical protein
MKSKRTWALKAAVGVALPALWIVGLSDASAAPPRAASSTVTRTGPAGNTSTRQSSVTTNGQGGYNAHSTVTGPNGNTATRQSSGAYNPATKTYTRSSTTTGPNGNTASSSSSVQATVNGGYNRSATHTGPAGNTATTQGSGSYNSATGTYNQSRTTTGPNGNSASTNRSVSVGTPQ